MKIKKETEVELQTIRVKEVVDSKTLIFDKQEEFFKLVNPEGTIFLNNAGDAIQIQEGDMMLILDGGVKKLEKISSK